MWGRTVYGGTARMGRRTAAHIDWTTERLAKEHPGARLRIIQSCYNTTVAASAGTHDKDGCLDVQIDGMDWYDAQHYLPGHGWAAWYRYPPTFSPSHIHMISLGCPGPVGIYVPGQIDDYYHHRTGLVGHYSDNSWHPSNIDSTVFNYPAYLKSKEPHLNSVEAVRLAITRAISENPVPANRRVARAMLKSIQAALRAGPKK